MVDIRPFCQWSVLGIGYRQSQVGRFKDLHGRVGGPMVLRVVYVPHLAVALTGLVLPAIWAWNHQRLRKRRRKGLCGSCHYDLRASKDRCPECGTPIPVGAASAAGNG